MPETPLDPRYPIGKYQPQEYSEDLRKEWINDIRFCPTNIENAILNLDQHQLDTPYRDGGWTIRQLIHHVADSHMNAYIRFKWGLTDPGGTIKTYNEKLWAELHDARTMPPNISITLLHALHARWVDLLIHMTKDDFDSQIFHPEKQQQISLWFMLGMYAWHSRHHTAHITVAREGFEL